jgi:4-hydroxy-tetrahydrodipicolinate synthase
VEIHFKAKYWVLNDAFIGKNSFKRLLIPESFPVGGRESPEGGYYTRLHYNCMVQVEPFSDFICTSHGLNRKKTRFDLPSLRRKKMHPLAGVYAAAVTPLKPDLSPDLNAIPGLLAFLAGRGCHGMLLLGTTGEGPSFSHEERLEIMRAALQVREINSNNQDTTIRLLAGTGTPSLTETISLTRSAFDLGYNGVVVLPPYYYRKASDNGLFQFFKTLISQAVPADGFLLGYHIPGLAGIGFSPDLLVRLKDAFPNQFAGIKDSSHDADFAGRLGERFGSDLLVLNGTDTYLTLALKAKAEGCITAPANLISPDLRKIWDAFQHAEDVALIQERVGEIRRILEKIPPLPPVLKALLTKLHGFPPWPVRPPLEVLAPDQINSLSEEFMAAMG